MAAASSSSQQPSDPWDLPIVLPTSRHRTPAVAQLVPDDWDNDDSDMEENNQRIWEDANAKTPNPMPTLILSPSAIGPSHVASPPPGAFQPTLRILKRPSNPGSNPTTPPPTLTSTESLKEREARYQAARERIFGSSASEGTASSDSASALSESFNSKDTQQWPTPQNARGVGVVRNPGGPVGGPHNAPLKGFRGQRTSAPLESSQHRTSSRENPVA
ncbi:hypothetical protein DXG03_000724 [Asterophora parasitica]|uniref:SUZ domain-containing protein n=1 Tax=Asterophora parasitica TaxID=117018 RepID=A0A9P7G3R3_9AGAR|nr:hypothetical protein DXG03_000724 [Asterophora parasitica]